MRTVVTTQDKCAIDDDDGDDQNDDLHDMDEYDEDRSDEYAISDQITILKTTNVNIQFKLNNMS